MTWCNGPPLFLLLVSFACFSFFFLAPLTSATSVSPFHLQTLRFPEDVVVVGGAGGSGGGRRSGVALQWEERRYLAEDETNTTLILAAERTRRRDPLDHFNKYTGGYNISNRHYWASVGHTAAPFFIIAGVWFLLFGLCLLCLAFICLCYCCCPREPYGYSRACYALSLIFLILFTIAAIVGCVVLYTGQGKFHSITTHTLEYVVNQANVTSENLRNVSDYLASARNFAVDAIFLPSNVQKDIDNIESKINSSATTLSDKTQKNSQNIQDGLNAMRMALIFLSGIMLALAFLGFLFSILGLQCLVYFLVIFGWILVAGTFILCGVFLLLHNVVADTCVAMDEWVQNPTAKTALDDIIPCVDNATAQETMTQTKEVTYQLVTAVDRAINNVANKNPPSQLPPQPPLLYNQSGPLVPLLCNPFYANFTDRQCVTGEVDLNNATQVWKNYTCQASTSGVCTTPGRLTLDMYNRMTNAVNLSNGLHHYGPFLAGLRDCSFVRQTFIGIRDSYCHDLQRYTQWIYIGLVMVSGAVMLSLIFWVIYARERRHRVYTKQFMSRSSEGQDKAS